MKISLTVLCNLIIRVVKAQASIFSDVYFHEIKARHAKLDPHPSRNLVLDACFIV